MIRLFALLAALGLFAVPAVAEMHENKATEVAPAVEATTEAVGVEAAEGEVKADEATQEGEEMAAEGEAAEGDMAEGEEKAAE